MHPARGLSLSPTEQPGSHMHAGVEVVTCIPATHSPGPSGRVRTLSHALQSEQHQGSALPACAYHPGFVSSCHETHWHRAGPTVGGKAAFPEMPKQAMGHSSCA